MSTMHLPSMSRGRYTGNRKRCGGKCKALLPATEEFFGSHAGRPDGLNDECRDCNNKSSQEYRARIRSGQQKVTRVKIPHVMLHGIEHKSCSRCARLKPADDKHFNRSNLSWDGFLGACKECKAEERNRK